MCILQFSTVLIQCCNPLRIGVLLNAVSFSMLSAPVLCDSNLSLYLSALAISDNGALIFNYAVSVAKSHSSSVNDLFMVNILCLINFLLLYIGPLVIKNSSIQTEQNQFGWLWLIKITIISIYSSNCSFQLDQGLPQLIALNKSQRRLRKRL